MAYTFPLAQLVEAEGFNCRLTAVAVGVEIDLSMIRYIVRNLDGVLITPTGAGTMQRLVGHGGTIVRQTVRATGPGETDVDLGPRVGLKGEESLPVAEEVIGGEPRA